MAENSRGRLIVLIRNSFIVTTPGRSTVNVMCADIGITINYILWCDFYRSIQENLNSTILISTLYGNENVNFR